MVPLMVTHGERSPNVILVDADACPVKAEIYRIAERHGLNAVLLNPVVRPYELLAPLVGLQKRFHTGEEYVFTTGHVAELQALEVERIVPVRYLLIVTTGDEVLDYRKAVARYRGCRQVVIEGGDHGLGCFADYLDIVLAHCRAAREPS